MLTTLVKQPGETFSAPVAFKSTSPITGVTGVTVTARGLVPNAAALVAVGSASNGQAMVSLTGGADGERYLVQVQAYDAAGELLEAEIDVAVVEGGWALPDGGAPYLSIADFVERFGFDEVVRMTDADGSGRIDRAMLTRALTDAQAVADAHLAGRYQLPLVQIPAMVALIIADLARARLYPRGAPEGVADAQKAALGYLLRIQAGQMALNAAAPAPVLDPVTPDRVLISPGRRYITDRFGERY